MKSKTAEFGHITFVEKKRGRIDASCSKCGQGIEVGERFGCIPGEELLQQWVKQHAHKARATKDA